MSFSTKQLILYLLINLGAMLLGAFIVVLMTHYITFHITSFNG